MNSTTCNNNTRQSRGSRRRHRGAYAPFSNLLNELMNTPLHSVADIKPMRTRPAINILQSETGYTIEMAIPGVAKESLDIKVNEGKLHISKKEETKDETSYRHKEFDYSSFERSFSLPKEADLENISAEAKDGVLTIHIAKVAKPEPKKITIS